MTSIHRWCDRVTGGSGTIGSAIARRFAYGVTCSTMCKEARR
jgi:NAD(P)-dependent dehydrogenase (short-subunit alcohol dehydrogenase family)